MPDWPWWAWVLTGMAVQDVAALTLLYRMGYRLDWSGSRGSPSE